MEVNFNVKKLNDLLIGLHVLTKTSLSFFDANYNFITSSDNKTDFCDAVRTNANNLKNCMISDKLHFKEAENKKCRIFYCCHAGLCETVSPIFYLNRLIGFLIIGRFIDKNGTFSNYEKTLTLIKNSNFDCKKMLGFYKKIPIISEEKLNTITSIVETCINGFCYDGSVKITHEQLAINIENFICENLDKKILLQEVCKKFYISKHKLYSILKENFNSTFTQFVAKKRIESAQKMLMETNRSVTEISGLLGYTNYNFFIKQFKSFSKLTPLQFRKNFNY